MALGKFGREGATAKMVAGALKLPVRTVQWNLHALLTAEVITQPFRGRFAYVPEELDLISWPSGVDGVHGIVLVSGPMRGATPPLVSLRSPKEWPPKPGYPRIRFVELDWEGRRVELWYYPGTDRFRVNVQNDRNPIPWIRVREFRGWLNGLFHPLSVDHWLPVEIGVNVDYPKLRMSGMKSGTFEGWQNAVERAYQKLADLLRLEFHTTPMDGEGRILPFDRVIEKLTEGSPVARMERMLEKELELERLKAENLLRQQGMPGTAKPPPLLDLTGFG